jgi:hypothetical protein
VHNSYHGSTERPSLLALVATPLYEVHQALHLRWEEEEEEEEEEEGTGAEEEGAEGE